mgnify:FL=1
MSSKKNGKDNLKDFIVDDDYMSHEDSDYEDEEDFNEDFYLPKKKRHASEGDIGEYKKNKHFKDLYFMKLSKN